MCIFNKKKYNKKFCSETLYLGIGKGTLCHKYKCLDTKQMCVSVCVDVRTSLKLGVNNAPCIAWSVRSSVVMTTTQHVLKHLRRVILREKSWRWSVSDWYKGFMKLILIEQRSV